MQVSTHADATSTDKAAAAAAATPSGAQVAEAVGRDLAEPIDTMRAALQDVRDRKRFTDAHLELLEQAVARAHRISLCSQQLARLAAGRLRQSHEKLALHDIVSQVMQGRSAQWRALGVEATCALKPVEVIVDPGLLVALLEAGLDWAAQQGVQLALKLEMKHWPEHGLLTIRTTRRPDAPEPDDVLWLLLGQTAAAMDLVLDRKADAAALVVTLEFPRTVGRLTALSAMEVDDAVRPGPSTWQLDSQSPPGHPSNRVLLITADPVLQREVTDICKLMDLKVFCTPTSEQGRRFSELSRPRMILIDEAAHDEAFDQWRAELSQGELPVPMLEISDDADSAFMVSAWDGENLSSIGRDVLGRKLIDAMTTEMRRG